MKPWLMRLAFLGALAFLGLTVFNASWLADTPRGMVKLVSHGGAMQYFDREAVAADGCSATAIEPVSHPYLENTGAGALRAVELGTWMVAVDLARTADDQLVVFGDTELDCRTNGSGPVSAKTAEELVKLDAGYGYTADGGATFPLRGEGVGAIRPVDILWRYVGPQRRVFYKFSSNDPAQADLLAAKMAAAGRDPAESKDAFYGPPEPIARIRQLYPDNWAFSPDAARQCASDYVMTGWYGAVPDSCKGGTMLIPVDAQWKFWGWPNRLIQRMEEHGGQVIVTGPEIDGYDMTGLTMPEQLGDVPNTFNGYLWVDDSWTVIPAFKPKLDGRRDSQKEAAAEALAKRRAN